MPQLPAPRPCDLSFLGEIHVRSTFRMAIDVDSRSPAKSYMHSRPLRCVFGFHCVNRGILKAAKIQLMLLVHCQASQNLVQSCMQIIAIGKNCGI